MNSLKKSKRFNRKDKFKKARERSFPRVPVSLERPTPEDYLILDGTLQNSARLIHLAQSNIQSLNLRLLECAALDPANRFAVVNHILYTSNSKISLRRKFDAISKSIEVHYYSPKNLQDIRIELANLHDQLRTALENESRNRFEEILHGLEGHLKTELARVKSDILLIARTKVFKVASIDPSHDWLFWDLCSVFLTNLGSEIVQGSFKHANDVSHSKLNSILPVKQIGSFPTPEGVTPYSHPLLVASIYKFRIHANPLRPDFSHVVSELNFLREEFDELLDLAQLKDKETRKADKERRMALERELEIRAELLREAQKKRKEELEQLEIEREAIIAKLLENDLNAPDGYHWSGAGWVSNNSRYQKGG